MGSQIIRQPDGLYGILSSYTDTIVVYDATEDEIIEWFVEQEAERTRRTVRGLLDHVAAGRPRKAYFQFTKTWQQALAMDREHGGEAWKDPKWMT